MKKGLSALFVGVLLAYLFMPSAAAQRGDLYGARALLALEQAFKTTGVLTFPNYATAPVVCNAANVGVYYYDTTTTDINICGAAGWVAVGAGFTVGTANTIPKWNAAPDDLIDTFLVEAGVPAAGAGGSVLAQTLTLNAMDGNDTVALVDLVITNADHTGANNFLTGLNVWGIIGDDQASEYGIQVGTGWDAQIWGNTTTLMMGSDLNVVSLLDDTFGVVVSWDLEQLAGEVNRWETIIANLAIMDGVGIDTATGLNIAMTNANHTDAGAGVFVYGLDISDLGGGADPDALEVAVNIGDGWDREIEFDGAANFIGFDSQIDFESTVAAARTSLTIFDWPPTAAAMSSLYMVMVGENQTLPIMDGNDTWSMLFIDFTNVDHTGATNFLYGLNIDGIVGDANADENAICIGTGWDHDLRLMNTAATVRLETSARLTFEENGQILYEMDGSEEAASPTHYFTMGIAPAVGADIMWLIDTMAIMNGSDTERGLFIDLTNANHTGSPNYLYGLDIDDIVADPDATEAAAHLDASWDYALWVEGTTQDIDHGLTTAVMLSPTLAANDDAADQRNVLLIDIDIPNGSAGLINGINVDAVTDDTDTIDSAIMIEGGWDSAITIFERGGVATSNPLTGSIFVYLDDSADYSGAGGNDCWLVLRDNAGNNHKIVEVVLNGACP